MKVEAEIVPGELTGEIERLHRELVHVNEPCRVAHAMAMSWRQRALVAEEQSRRLEQKYHNLKKRKGLEHEADMHDEDKHAGVVVPGV